MTVILAIISILSFIITFYVGIKTKNINVIINEMKTKRKFNKERTQHYKTLQQFQVSIDEDGVKLSVFQTRLLTELYDISYKYSDVFRLYEKMKLKIFIKKLIKSNFKSEKDVSLRISEILSFLSENKEDDLK